MKQNSYFKSVREEEATLCVGDKEYLIKKDQFGNADYLGFDLGDWLDLDVNTKLIEIWEETHYFRQGVNFVGIGYGTEAEIAKRLPEGTRSVIRDDAAAEVGMPDCWFASDLEPTEAGEAYCDGEGELDGAVYSVDELIRWANLGY